MDPMKMEMQTTVSELSSGVWAIDQGMVRSFLIVGTQRALLLDTGAGACDLLGMIRGITALPLTLVQTHGDGDHTANSALFPEVFAHPAEFENICQFRPELREKLRPVQEGDRFDLGGRVLAVIDAPGHTPGSICLLDREHRILFSGDTVSYGPVFLFGKYRDIHTYRKTLLKLMALEGYDTVYPCHNTCPVTPEIIPELIAAVDGALDGSIEGVPEDMPMPMPGGEAPLVYASGKCGILYIKN